MQNQPVRQTPPLYHPQPQHVHKVPNVRSPAPFPQTPEGPQQAAEHNYYQRHQQTGSSGMNYYPNGIPPGQPHMANQHHPQQYGVGQQINPNISMQQQQQPQDHYYSEHIQQFMEKNQFTYGIGKMAFQTGNEYMGKSLTRYMNVSQLKYLFNVTNNYVVKKIGIILFPWKHRPWTRKAAVNSASETVGMGGHAHAVQQAEEHRYAPPRDDINAPDLYIPVMSIITYVLLSAQIAGLKGAFHPELLGSVAGTAAFVVFLEVLGLKVVSYVLSISNEANLLELCAYSSYKFVGVIASMAANALFSGWISWGVFIYSYLATALFLLRSLRYVILSDTGVQAGNPHYNIAAKAQRDRQTQVLFVYAYLVQLLFMWMLA